MYRVERKNGNTQSVAITDEAKSVPLNFKVKKLFFLALYSTHHEGEIVLPKELNGKIANTANVWVLTATLRFS